VVTLLMGTCVTYYCTLILASLWDWDEPNRYVRYRDLGRSIYGKLNSLLLEPTFEKSVLNLERNELFRVKVPWPLNGRDPLMR